MNLSVQEYVEHAVRKAVHEGQSFFYRRSDRSSTAGDARFTFIDLFAGIGGMRLGLEANGGECLFTSEWDRWSQKTYAANFDDIPSGDITKIPIEEIPDHDILAAGFPCQPFSLAGVSKKNSLGREHGFKDKTQGTLFFNVASIIEAKRPSMFLLENVKNLRGHDKGRTYKVIMETLQQLGYWVHSEVIDARHWVPQHRERIFLVGFDRKIYGDFVPFNFPAPPEKRRVLGEILDVDVEDRYVLSDKLWQYLQDYAAKHREKGNGFGFGLVDGGSVTRTLSARYHKDGSEILISRNGSNPRRLTPRECARLMGFPDDFIIPVSDTQAYRQFGNAVVVPLVRDIVAAMLEAHESVLEERSARTNGRLHEGEEKPGHVPHPGQGHKA
jgi:DNA (cytosine-5)-methyltransferase 1